MSYGRAILASVGCWVVFVILPPGAFTEEEGAFALKASIGCFLFFALVLGIMHGSNGSRYTNVVPYRAAQKEPPPLKLKEGLIVDDELNAMGIAQAGPQEAPEAVEAAREVQRLYAALDD